MNARYPETTAELFDLCHDLFGIGNYDEFAANQLPWFKVRMNEIGKLNRILKARGIEVRTMAIAAEYCADKLIPIKATGELIAHITDALIDLRARENDARTQRLHDRINNAVEVALLKGSSDTAERLMRMPVAVAEDLIDEIEAALGIDS